MSETFAPPVADPGQHVNPAQAAKELRKLMRLALDYMDSGSSDGGIGKERWRHALSNARNAENYLATVDQMIPQVEEALRKRQTAPGIAALKTLRGYTPYINEAIRAVKAYAEAELAITPSQNLTFNTATSKQLRLTLERIHVLVQSLPTITGGPSNLPENVLRTIGVILENAGYVAKKIPDALPSLEDEEPEDEEEGEE